MRRHDSRLHSGSRSDEGDYLLRRLCSKKATNDVDKIFAVRAFFPETFGMLTPDYSQTTAKVFTDAARSLLDAHHNVRFMRFASHGGIDDKLPTWVPAWTPIHKHRWIWGIRATGRPLYQPALVAKNVDGNVLQIKALRVDSLTATISDFIPKLFPIGRERDYNFKDLCAAHAACAVFKAWIEKLGAMSNGAEYLNRLDSMVDRMSLMYLGWNRLLQSMKAFDYDADGTCRYSIRAEPRKARSMEEDLKRLVSEIEDHCFFLTAAGTVGVAPVPVREGDEIILLTGETLPYIIRKSSDGRGRYAVVSPCMLTDEITVEQTSGVTKQHPLQEWFWGRPSAAMVKAADCKSWGYIDLV
ncbi:uncharacterized protein TRIVIDRAFT_223395 [Trichoderma virens Gv29-8]|uniref:Heterokaryon incompatibility domain-containing protein n=1 Tax=Hypocrea virens (strain Gv29-8 / FGSC 10586) TaxID=413071 RepID=G9MWZ8_HYPVG|nr:uncharacterized protein TRIVIDRAFT_223395 [Trichoderma virens Gv29-8]EHK20931.1 hypothetical protein TRIVIDRAFT_223395 [Trichoderma virens Gv29-8]UKZ52375.1 hypothetical protein TrVGV298_006151 [Trichoderma virens]